MKYIISILTFLLIPVISAMGQEFFITFDNYEDAKKMMAKVDHIYDQLPDSDKQSLHDLSLLPFDLAENRHHFIRSSMHDLSIYSYLLRLFGQDIIDFYMNDDATQDHGAYYVSKKYEDYRKKLNKEYEDNRDFYPHPRAYYVSKEYEDYRKKLNKEYEDNRDFYPLDYAAENKGSMILYSLAQYLKDNHNCMYLRNWNGTRSYYLSREAKSYNLHDAESMKALHQYPKAYSYLSTKDDSLYYYIKEFKNLGFDGRVTKMAYDMLVEKSQLLGNEHPCYALTLSDLAMFYCIRLEHIKAIRLQKEALEIYRKMGNTVALQLAAKQLSYLYYKLAQNIHSNKKGLQPTLDILDTPFDIKSIQKEMWADSLALGFSSLIDTSSDSLPEEDVIDVIMDEECALEPSEFLSDEVLLNIKLSSKELSIIEPILGGEADEVKSAKEEIDDFKKLRLNTHRDARIGLRYAAPNFSNETAIELNKCLKLDGRFF